MLSRESKLHLRVRVEMLRSFLISAGLASTMVFAPAAEAAGKQRPFPMILLQCASESENAQILCKALLDPLAEKAPDYLSRIEDSKATLRAEDIRLILSVSDETDHGLAGQLSWSSGPDGALQSGPIIRLDVMDTAVSERIITRFAADLLTATPEFNP